MTPQDLKNSILQLAIQGKLVEQRAEEGMAEELYQEIQAEKQRLIAEGKIKKEKKLPDIAEGEIPFEIPESWKWVRLCEISQGGLGKTLNKAKDMGEEKPYLCSINVYWDGISLDKIKSAAFTEEDQEKYRLAKGDLLICEGGDAGRSAIWDSDQEMYYQNALHRIRFYGHIDANFFLRCLELYKGNGTIDAHCKGVTIKHLVQNSLNEILFPLPPLAEQKRIVAKIEKLLPYIDRYEKSWTKLEDFNTRFPDDMQKSILQLAIQGRLVEQREEEGTAEELYQQIQEEKQKLIAEGKIKKEKKLPEITEDEIPFEIPESWKWVRVQTITNGVGDGIHGTPQFDENGQYYFINGNNLCNGTIEYKHNTKMVNESEYLKYEKVISNNAILLSINGTIGNIAYYQGEKIVLGKSACYVDLLAVINRKYIRILLESDFFFQYAVKKSTQTTIKNVSLKSIRMLPIPLPPLAEQKRIVAKIEELMPYCRRLQQQ